MIVIEGLVITVLVLTAFRETILNAIPMDLKRAIGIGIGLFIAIIGLVNAGVVVAGTGTPRRRSTPTSRRCRMLMFVVGLALTAALVARRSRGALLIGILVDDGVRDRRQRRLGTRAIWAARASRRSRTRSSTTPDFDLVGNFAFGFFSVLGSATALAAILSVMLSDFFDTMGTVVGLGGEAAARRGGQAARHQEGAAGGLARRRRRRRRLGVVEHDLHRERGGHRARAAGPASTAVVVGVLFLLAMFFSPIAGIVPPEATAPVLIIVGYFMMRSVEDIDWRDPGIGIPALLTMTLMPFTYSITNGVGAGFVSYTVIKVLQGKGREVHPLMYLVSRDLRLVLLHGVL